jgi:hypothetical protein
MPAMETGDPCQLGREREPAGPRRPERGDLWLKSKRRSARILRAVAWWKKARSIAAITATTRAAPWSFPVTAGTLNAPSRVLRRQPRLGATPQLGGGSSPERFETICHRGWWSVAVRRRSCPPRYTSQAAAHPFSTSPRLLHLLATPPQRFMRASPRGP